MRPEYVEAVDAVRWGWSLYAPFIVSGMLIWCVALSKFRGYGTHILSFMLACCLFWVIFVYHVESLQSTKQRLMQTEEEMDDWSSDTWRVFAPVTVIPSVLGWCLLNSVVSYPVGWVVNDVRTRRSSRIDESLNSDDGAGSA